MEHKRGNVRRHAVPAMFALITMLAAGAARAQAADETPPPGPPGAPPPSSVVATEAKPPAATEAMPASRPEVLPPIEVGAWVRVGGSFQGADQSKINDWHMDTEYVELHTGGRLTKHVGVTLNLDAEATNFAMPGSSPGNYVGIEDAILQFDFLPEVHLWAGHLLVPVDRTNLGGPWFAVMWNFPAGLAVGVALPKSGPPWNVGRNNGAVVWGDIAGGKLGYYAGAFDNGDVTSSPLFVGHLRLALLDPENGFWGNGSYFGKKDILSFDLGGQFQKDGDAAGKDWAEFNIGVLLEKKLAAGSWVTAEGNYYQYNVADGAPKRSFYVLGAFATPEIGVGHIQPMVRYQWAAIQGGTIPNPWNIDAGLGYLIKGPALRIVATYSHTKNAALMSSSDGTANAIQLGAQGIFF